MAIIKCPECGHSISDKAPVCPSCGVEIAGKMIICARCGMVYFKNQPECPNCHQLTSNAMNGSDNNEKNTPTPPPLDATTIQNRDIKTEQTANNTNEQTSEPTPQKQSKSKLILICFVIALIAVGICYAFYSNARNDKEQDAYEYAMQSKDAMVLQSYLDTYKDAPEEHRDSIQNHLNLLQQLDKDWTDAVVSGSISALKEYIEKHPNSPYIAQANQKIDSIDWDNAQGENTTESYEQYLEGHPSGEHADEANEKLKDINSNTVQPEEKQIIAATFRNFFNGISNKDEDLLTSTVSPLMTSFLGKNDATRSDVVTFLHKIYKSEIENMTWASAGDYNIKKKDTGDEQYEYTITFTAKQVIVNKDASETRNTYHIKSKMNSDGQIFEFNMTRVVE